MTFTTTVTSSTNVLSTVSGSAQMLIAGTAAANPFVIRVVDATGAAVVGVPITFAIATGAGNLSASTVNTSAAGTAQVFYTAGATAGTATVTATGPGLTPVTFSSTVLAATNVLSVVSGAAQSVRVSTPAAAFTVRVADALGVSVAGSTVTWTVVSGGGTLSAASSMTNATGNATITYTAGTAVGTSVVTGTIAGGGSVTFTTTITN